MLPRPAKRLHRSGPNVRINLARTTSSHFGKGLEPRMIAGNPRSRLDVPGTAPHRLRSTAKEVLFGTIGVAVVTFVVALYFHLSTIPESGVGPGTISLLYL